MRDILELHSGTPSGTGVSPSKMVDFNEMFQFKKYFVEEAKIIYETLQSAVGASAPKRQPKSLNEVVTKRSSAFMPRKEEKRGDPLAARMKALAGITDK